MTKQTNWKDVIYHPQEPATPQPIKDWLTESEIEFIEKEVIEKIIDDIPDDKYIADITTGDDPIPTNELKTKLRDKYLNAERQKE